MSPPEFRRYGFQPSLCWKAEAQEAGDFLLFLCIWDQQLFHAVQAERLAATISRRFLAGFWDYCLNGKKRSDNVTLLVRSNLSPMNSKGSVSITEWSCTGHLWPSSNVVRQYFRIDWHWEPWPSSFPCESTTNLRDQELWLSLIQSL